MSWFFASSAKILELQLQQQYFQWIVRVDFLYDGQFWSPCCPRDSQESSPAPAPQLGRINSSTLNFLYVQTLTSKHDNWKNHSIDYMDICWQSEVFVIYLFIFNMLSRFFIVFLARTSLVAQRVKRLPPMWETWVRSLGREDTLEKDMAIHSSTIPWKIPWTEKPGRLQSMGS